MRYVVIKFAPLFIVATGGLLQAEARDRFHTVSAGEAIVVPHCPAVRESAPEAAATPVSVQEPPDTDTVVIGHSPGFAVRDMSLSCERWMDAVDVHVTDRAASGLLSADEARFVSRHMIQCSVFRQHARQWASEQHRAGVGVDSANWPLHLELITFARAGDWDKILVKVCDGEVPTDHRLSHAFGIPVGISIMGIAIDFDAPQTVFEQLALMGLKRDTHAFRGAVWFGKPQFLYAMVAQGEDLNRAFRGRNLYLAVSPRMRDFLHQEQSARARVPPLSRSALVALGVDPEQDYLVEYLGAHSPGVW